MSSPRPPSDSHWKTIRKLTFSLLAVWFVVTFGVIFFARELSHWSLFGWPVSFFMAAQGLTIFYVAIVALYAFLVNRADAKNHETDSV